MKVKFVPQNIEVETTPDKTLLQIANENHIEIKSICKGVPSCAECRVRIVDGENNVVPPGKPELGLIGSSYFLDQRRLSCQVHCFGDVTVDLTEQIERAKNEKKKTRGFRTSKTIESHAIQDTMILNEKVDETPEAPARPERPPPQQNRAQNNRGSGGRGQGGGGRNSGKPQQSSRNNNQNNNQNRSPKKP